jgi:hypothetical protein
MDNEILCPSCNLAASRGFNFCENCEAQLNCLNPDCGKSLVAGKTICLYCGMAVAATGTNYSNHGNSFFRFVEQKGEDLTERISIDMTDHAVSELAPFIAGQIVPRGSNGRNTLRSNDENEHRIRTLLGDDNGATQPDSFQDVSDFNYAQQVSDPSSAPQVDIDSSVQPNGAEYKVFERDGDKLVAIEKDFKGSNFKDQLRRFLVLFASEYGRIFRKPVPNAKDFQQAAKQASLYNPKIHATYFKAAAKEFLTELSEGYKLNNDGEKEFKKIVGEMRDDTKSGFAYWEQSGSGSGKAPVRFGKDDEAKVVGWTVDEVELGKLEIGDLKKALDTLLVGIWILTVKLQKEKAVRWVDAHQYLKRKFTTIKATGNAISIALGKPASAKYVVKAGDTLYLNSEGKTLVENWIANGLNSASESAD